MSQSVWGGFELRWRKLRVAASSSDAQLQAELKEWVEKLHAEARLKGVRNSAELSDFMEGRAALQSLKLRALARADPRIQRGLEDFESRLERALLAEE